MIILLNHFYTKAQNTFIKLANKRKNYFVIDSSSDDSFLEKKIYNIVNRYLKIK